MNTEILYSLAAVLILLLVDTVLGVARAVKRRKFSWGKLADTLHHNVLPYVIPLIVMGLLASVGGPAAGVLTGIYGALTATYVTKLMADIVAKVNDLYGTNVDG